MVFPGLATPPLTGYGWLRSGKIMFGLEPLANCVVRKWSKASVDVAWKSFMLKTLEAGANCRPLGSGDRPAKFYD